MNKYEIKGIRELFMIEAYGAYHRQYEKIDPPEAFYNEPLPEFPRNEHLLDVVEYDSENEWKAQHIDFYMTENEMTEEEALEYVNKIILD